MTHENIDCLDRESTSKQKKPPKRGIIYLSSIPPYMNVSRIREQFSQFGTVGRVYLQLADTELKSKEKKSKKHKFARKFTEGWVEFERKSVAKKVAALLNNTQVSNRKKSKHYDCIWNIKYLSSFKWTHLHERLAYEKAARRHKLRAEIQLAKKKTNFFSANLNKITKDNTFVNKEYENLSSKMDENVEVHDTEDTKNRTKFLQSLFS
ncbi:activator of basal transcription 1-like [Anoplophora glabripennis]|uniref:activator of basal transcription 1-like n=1 Tax=Anoplophora glabripennis TaxID=217634 RepID=UPI00087394D1|nr:activator of basal transcription 1-like [Anoplophora glabripennis]